MKTLRDLYKFLDGVERSADEWTPESACAWIRAHWDHERASRISARIPYVTDVRVSDNRVTMLASLCVRARGEDLPFDLESMADKPLSLCGTESLRGCPRRMERNPLYVESVGSFEGAPVVLGEGRGHTTILFLDVASLSGVHEHFGEVRGVVRIGSAVKRNVLGLLKIPGVRSIRPHFESERNGFLEQDALSLVAEILNENVGKGLAGVVKAQRALIEIGLDEYAEL